MWPAKPNFGGESWCRKSASQRQRDGKPDGRPLQQCLASKSQIMPNFNLLLIVCDARFQAGYIQTKKIGPGRTNINRNDVKIKHCIFQTGLQVASTTICLCMSAMMPKVPNFLLKNSAFERHPRLSCTANGLVSEAAPCEGGRS